MKFPNLELAIAICLINSSSIWEMFFKVFCSNLLRILFIGEVVSTTDVEQETTTDDQVETTTDFDTTAACEVQPASAGKL